MVTGDSHEEVIIFRDRQTDRHFIIIYILTCSDQSLAKTVNKSDQRMVISICGQSSLSLCSIFLISHLKTIRPCKTKKLRPRFLSKICELFWLDQHRHHVCAKIKQQNSDPSLASHLVSKTSKPLSIILLIAPLKII